MTRGDKAALRLTIGLGLAVFVAYGLGLQVPFVVCIMALLVLCKPGPPLPLLKSLVIAAVFAVLVAAGVLMVPLLEHYAAAGVLLTAVLLFGLFYMGQLRANPLTTVLVLAFTLIPVAGVQEQALVGVLAGTLAVGVLVGGAVSAASNAIFPDPPAPAAHAKPATAPDRENARWLAWRGTLIVMPVFVLALTNPSFYMAAIMKTVALGEQIDALVVQHAPRVLVLDLSRVPDIEYSALQALIEGDKRLAERGVTLWLAGLNPGVLEVVRRAGFDRQLGPERLLFNARAAIVRYRTMEDEASAQTPPP